MFARPIDMEPGMAFFDRGHGGILRFVGVDPVVSRFAGKRRVRVLVKGGRSFVADRGALFPVLGGERS